MVTSAQVPAAGIRLGPYRLLKKIGGGGMGTVYLAEDTDLDRKVALKIIKPDAYSNSRLRRQFLEEARAAAALEHPHIVPIHAAGQENGLVYFTMPVLEGTTLADLQKEGIPGLDKTVVWMHQMADALSFAHSRGILHLDVKPGNIMIDSFDRAVLVDFGLARVMQGGRDQSDEPLRVTPSFAAPEQLLGGNVDKQADIYSLGAVLYFMLTATVPLAGGSDADLAKRKVHGEKPAPVRSLNPEVPEEVASLTDRMVAHSPKHRPATMAEVRDALAIHMPTELGTVNSALSRIIRRVDKVPPFPQVGFQLLEEMQHELTNVGRLQQIISADSVLAARILRVVNSAYYGVSQEVTSIRLAISLLGLNQIRDLAFGIYMRDLGRKLGGRENPLQRRCWIHSVATAFLSEGVSRILASPTTPPGESYLAGLLHDVGLFLLSQHQSEEMAKVVWAQYERKVPPVDVEREILGTDHLEVGEWLGRKWNLPEAILDVAIHHHEALPDSPLAELETVVRIADEIALRTNYGFYVSAYGWDLEPEILGMLRRTHPRLPEEGLLAHFQTELGEVFRRLEKYLAAFDESAGEKGKQTTSSPRSETSVRRPRRRRPAPLSLGGRIKAWLRRVLS